MSEPTVESLQAELAESKAQAAALRHRVEELAHINNTYADDLEAEQAKVAALVRVVEEVGRQLLAADKNEETP